MTGRQPEYQNLKRYKKQKDVTAQNVLTIFTTTFLVMLVLFVGVAKQMTPSVDVSIGEDSATDAKESGLGVKGFIDNRLKAIQSEDSTSEIAKKLEEKAKSTFDEEDEDEYFSKDLEEKVKIPTRTVKQEITTKKDDEAEKVTVKVVKPTAVPQPKPITQQQTDQTSATPTSIKVVVGSYSSIDQAKIAQTILQESSVGVTPFIKNIHGTYTLQVGSFNSEAKAQSLANELLKNNFPARIVR